MGFQLHLLLIISLATRCNEHSWKLLVGREGAGGEGVPIWGREEFSRGTPGAPADRQDISAALLVKASCRFVAKLWITHVRYLLKKNQNNPTNKTIRLK